MEYKIDDSSERKVIKRIFFLIIIVLVAIISMYLYNNTKYIYLLNVYKVKSSATRFIKEETKFYSDIFKEKMYTKINLVNNQENGIDEKMDVSVNINKDNVYNSININNMINIYEENGIYYVHIPNDNKIIKLNDEPITFNEIDNNTGSNITKVVNKISLKIITKFNDSDFYKIPYTITDEKGKNHTKYIYGMRISEKRMQEILLDVLEEIKNDTRFMNKLSIVAGKTDTILNEDINQIIASLRNYISSEDLVLNIEMKTKGLLNTRPTEISINFENKSVVLNQINILIQDDGIHISIPGVNDNISILVNLKDSRKEILLENSNINGEKIKNSFVIEKYTNERKITNTLNINDSIFTVKGNIQKDNENNIINFNGELLNQNSKVYSLTGDISYIDSKENVENFKVFSFNEVEEKDREYIRAYLGDTWNLYNMIKN